MGIVVGLLAAVAAVMAAGATTLRIGRTEAVGPGDVRPAVAMRTFQNVRHDEVRYDG